MKAQKAFAAIGETRTGYILGSIFDVWELAEDEIDKAKKRHPDKKQEIHDSFKILMPGVLLGKHEALYRAHCHEILERVALDTDTAPGTRAEALAVLSDTSLMVPLGDTAYSLFAELFSEIMGQFEGPLPGETYEGAKRELLEKIQRKLTHERDCHLA